MADSPDSTAEFVRVPVLLPLPLSGPYDYLGAGLEPGDIVEVPLSSRRLPGVVWDSGAGDVPTARLRPILRRYDVPPMGAPLRRLIGWMANYTLSRPGSVLRMALNVPAALMPAGAEPAYRPAPGGTPDGVRMTAQRTKVLAVLEGEVPRRAADIAREAGVGIGVVKGLAALGALEETAAPVGTARPDPDFAAVDLTPEQAAAAAELRGRGFGVSLLEGVTGAGKTEVYFEAVAEALRAGLQALVLLPEIALTAQWLMRFESRFGRRPLAWHSELGAAERRAGWRAVAEGRAPVVVGARSALLLPFRSLGLIVVDEEHERTFKQDDGVAYHARDMAVARGRFEDVPVVLASATPSLESVENVRAGRYRPLHLTRRYARAALPEIVLVDLRRRPPPAGRWLSPVLEEAVRNGIEAGEQSLLFLNRRGYAPLTLCRACGHRLECPNCSAWLVEHRLLGRLQCHHCGHGIPLPDACPSCLAEGSLVACGPGVERVAEETGALFPDARKVTISSDSLQGPAAVERFVGRMEAREIDILIGTQLAAKGHHFPWLTTVGVVDGDLGLAGGDLRASERTHQVLTQVAGRAGRAGRPGRALIQTWQPESPVMQALLSGDRETFLEVERQARRETGMPPFGRLAALILSSPDRQAVEAAARTLARRVPDGDGIEVLGPAPAPLAVLRGRHRWRLLLKCPRERRIQPLLRSWLAGQRLPGRVSIRIDVDPYSFM